MAVDRVPGFYAGEPEIDAGRRAFAKAQELLESPPHERLSSLLDIGWHSTQTDPETGSFAVVGENSSWDVLIGETLRITVPATTRTVYVYVLGARDVPVPISVTRAVFLRLGLLALESLPCIVEVTA
jgi:hypothetical protein